MAGADPPPAPLRGAAWKPGVRAPRTLLVASTGGHLAELHRLVPRLPVGERRTWITFDEPHSRGLLAGEDVRYIRTTAPRDWRNVAANAPEVARILADGPWERVVSTGSAIALTVLPLARAFGLPAHYIEIAARSVGPSVTGRLLSAVPGVRLYTQYPSWAGRRWRFAGSVYDDFTVQGAEAAVPGRVVVTVGTLDYPFSRLVDRLRGLLPPEVETVWQVGTTPAHGLPGRVHHQLPPRELDEEMRRADVVVAHAGTGSALAALEAGRIPVLVPRRHAWGEHVDDHQELIAEALAGRGLAVARPVEALEWADLAAAAGRRAVRVGHAAPFRLRD